MLDISFQPLARAAIAVADIPALGRQNSRLRMGGAFAIDRVAYRGLCAEMERHVAEIQRVVLAQHGTRWHELAEDLNYPRKLRCLLSGTHGPDPFTIGRVDFVVSNGLPHIVEFNFTSSVGGAAALDIMHERLAACSDLLSPGRPNRARLEIVCDELARCPSRSVLIPLWPWSHIAEPDRFFRDTREFLTSRGAHVKLVPLADLASVLLEDRDAIVLRLFDTADARLHGFDLEKLGLGQPGLGRWLMGELPNVVSSKSLMAARPLQEALGGPRCWLAPTAVVGTPARAGLDLISMDARIVEAERTNLVLKPSHGHSGQQVTIGAQVDQETWRTALEQAKAAPFVAQRWFAPDAMPMAFQDVASGERLSLSGPAVFGMYIVSGRAEGVLVRAIPERKPIGAINSGRGAVVSALMLR